MTTAFEDRPDDELCLGDAPLEIVPDERPTGSPDAMTRSASPHHRRRVRMRRSRAGATAPRPEPGDDGAGTTVRSGSTRDPKPIAAARPAASGRDQYAFPFAAGQDDPYESERPRRRSAGRPSERDLELLAATVTGSPSRVDDATEPFAGPPEYLGSLQFPRSCYVCKSRYRKVYSFYHALCPTCAAENWVRRHARADLGGRRALMTGGRAKIGQEVVLRLLRDGADVTLTTRFPSDAADRFTAIEDYDDWSDRLHVVGIDLRQLDQVMRLAHEIADAGPLDILINNAAQTVRRTAEAYSPLLAREQAGELPGVHDTRRMLTARVDPSADDMPHLATGRRGDGDDGPVALDSSRRQGDVLIPSATTAPDLDAGGLIPDRVPANSWSKKVDEIDPVEMLEVQLINVTVPFLLVSNLRAAMAAARSARRYVVNVSAVEGQFGRHYKNPTHPHTNMAKAALNMLTRTSSPDLRRDGIYMNSVDTGWITDERPYAQRAHEASAGFRAPLDLADGAARVYDPIVRGELGEEIFGCFLKDYGPAPW